jgi:hypothetical protein
MIRIVPLLWLVVWSSAFAMDKSAGLPDLVSQNYSEIRDLSLSILQRYPPSEYWYVGIGRSPTPIMRFFEEMGVQTVSQMPLSGMSDFPKKGPMSEADQRARLWSHFERWLPSKAKKILVIDYTAGGGGLTHTKNELEGYFENRRKRGLPASEFRTLALSETDWAKQAGKSGGIDSLVISSRLESAFRYSSFEKWAKYGPFHPWKDSEASLHARPEFEQLGQSLRTQMRSDSHVRAAQSATCVQSIKAGLGKF